MSLALAAYPDKRDALIAFPVENGGVPRSGAEARESIKRALEAGYCLCKGKVGGEFALTFPAYNMKRAINILGAKNLLKAFA
jgi:hypothetical protein